MHCSKEDGRNHQDDLLRDVRIDRSPLEVPIDPDPIPCCLGDTAKYEDGEPPVSGVGYLPRMQESREGEEGGKEDGEPEVRSVPVGTVLRDAGEVGV